MPDGPLKYNKYTNYNTITHNNTRSTRSLMTTWLKVQIRSNFIDLQEGNWLLTQSLSVRINMRIRHVVLNELSFLFFLYFKDPPGDCSCVLHIYTYTRTQYIYTHIQCICTYTHIQYLYTYTDLFVLININVAPTLLL